MNTMKLNTLLNEGISKRNAGNNNLKGSLLEDFDEVGQPELDLGMTISGGKSPNISKLIDRFGDIGAQVGSKYGEILMREVKDILRSHYLRMGIETNANGIEDDDEMEEAMFEDDAFMDIMYQVTDSFLEGLSNNWPAPLNLD